MKPVFLLLAALLMVAASALASCGGEPHAAVSPASGQTAVRESGYRITLPGSWSVQPGTDSSVRIYRSESNEQLTVSRFYFSHPLSIARRWGALKEVVRIRRRAERNTPGVGATTLTRTGYGQQHGILAARYGGVEPDAKRRFWCLLLTGSKGVVVFYYECLDSSESRASERAKLIFDSAQVAQ